MEVNGVGMPDKWHRLWAPHRLEYLRGENRPLETNEIPCPFCDIPTKDDKTGLIVKRGETLPLVFGPFPAEK